MKKLIGMIVIILGLLICVIYRQLTNPAARARSEKASPMEPVRFPLFFTLLQLH